MSKDKTTIILARVERECINIHEDVYVILAQLILASISHKNARDDKEGIETKSITNEKAS